MALFRFPSGLVHRHQKEEDVEHIELLPDAVELDQVAATTTNESRRQEGHNVADVQGVEEDVHKAQKVDGDVVKVQDDDLGHQSTKARQSHEEPVEEGHQVVPGRVQAEATRLSRDHHQVHDVPVVELVRHSPAARTRQPQRGSSHRANGRRGRRPRQRAPIQGSATKLSFEPLKGTLQSYGLCYTSQICACHPCHEKLTLCFNQHSPFSFDIYRPLWILVCA